jgi:hypothetical protein
MNTRKLSAIAVAIVVASLTLSACEDQVVPTQQTKDAAPRLEVPASDRRIVLTGSQTPPASVPAEYRHYTWINVIADVGWLDAHTAYGQAIVQYGANNATADINLSVRNASGAVIGTNSAHASESWVFPGDRTLRQSTTVYVTPTCGSVAQATANGGAFDSWMNTSQNTLKWGDVSQGDTKSSPQAACALPPTCQDGTATNYGAPLPCTYPPPPPSTGGAPMPPSGTGYPGQYYTPPSYSVGHWECTRWNAGTPYEVQNCVWVTGYRSRSPLALPSLTRSVAPETPVRTQSTADLPSVFVIVSDQVPPDAIGVIERHKTGPLKNVLLIPSSTIRPAVFVAAMQALYDSRDKEGDTLPKDLSLTLRGTILDQHIPLTSREYAAAFTAQIASSRKGDAGAYGTRQIIEFKLGAKN